MLRNAHGTSAPPTGDRARVDLRAHDAVTRTLDELALLVGAGHEVGRGDVLSALDRAGVRGDAAGAPGRVAVFDLARARTRRFDVVFVLGLEQGTLPRRARVEPFLDEDTRRALDERRGARLVRPDAASRDRYLFATVCSRPRRRLVLVRQAVGRRGITARGRAVLGGGARALRRGRRPAPDAPTAAVRPDLGARGRAHRARAAAGAGRARRRRSCRSRLAGPGERLGQAARARDPRVRPSDAGHARARPAPAGAGLVLRLGARADGVLLGRMVRRALPAPVDDRQADRPHAARLDPACRAPALLRQAPERDPGRRPRDRGERRGGGRPDAGMRHRRGRDGPSDRGGRPRPARARAGRCSAISSSSSATRRRRPHRSSHVISRCRSGRSSSSPESR